MQTGMTDLCVRALFAMVADKLPKYRHQYYILTTLSTYVVEGGLCVEAQYDGRVLSEMCRRIVRHRKN